MGHPRLSLRGCPLENPQRSGGSISCRRWRVYALLWERPRWRTLAASSRQPHRQIVRLRYTLLIKHCCNEEQQQGLENYLFLSIFISDKRLPATIASINH